MHIRFYKTLYSAKLIHFFMGHERNGLAFPLGAAGATDAMDSKDMKLLLNPARAFPVNRATGTMKNEMGLAKSLGDEDRTVFQGKLGNAARKRKLIGARGFEPPTSWSRTRFRC